MQTQWDELQARYDELSNQLASSSLESSKRNEFQKELSRISELLRAHNKVLSLEQQLQDSRKQLQTDDSELKAMFAEEVEGLERDHAQAVRNLDNILYPPNEHDNRSVFLEIRSGAGGKEAALFAADLLKMYTNYALRQGWKATVESFSTTELGGFREVVLYIKGQDAYGYLKHESGVHRVQRVPETETQGRIHTSTATVAVLPEAQEVDITVLPSDLRIDVFRASGAGGQHVNTTDSAVRITHIPTGVVVSCQDERSQHKNKAKALKILSSRILAARVEKADAQMSLDRKALVGGGTRSEKVRTYNYPQNRVTDHQVELTLKKLDIVMTGYLDEIIDALRDQELRQRKEHVLALKK
jgi:peptide chain release factor 1